MSLVDDVLAFVGPGYHAPQAPAPLPDPPPPKTTTRPARKSNVSDGRKRYLHVALCAYCQRPRRNDLTCGRRLCREVRE